MFSVLCVLCDPHTRHSAMAAIAMPAGCSKGAVIILAMCLRPSPYHHCQKEIPCFM